MRGLVFANSWTRTQHSTEMWALFEGKVLLHPPCTKSLRWFKMEIFVGNLCALNQSLNRDGAFGRFGRRAVQAR